MSHPFVMIVKLTPNLANIKPGLALLLQKHPQVSEIVAALAAQGGTSYLVGGAVRDLLIGLPVHDLDIEVHFFS